MGVEHRNKFSSRTSSDVLFKILLAIFFFKCFFRFGVEAPSKLSLLGGVALIAVGGALVLSVLVIDAHEIFSVAV